MPGIWTRFHPAFKWDEGERRLSLLLARVWGLGGSLASPRLCLAPGRLESIVSLRHLAAGMSLLSAAGTQAILLGIRWSIRLAYKMLMAFSKSGTSPAQEQGN